MGVPGSRRTHENGVNRRLCAGIFLPRACVPFLIIPTNATRRKGGKEMNARVWVFQMAKALALILVVGLSACSVDHGADQCQEVDALPESPAIAALGDSVFSTHWETCQCVAGHLSLLSGEKMWDYSAGGERVTHPTAHDIYEQYEDASREMAELKTVVFDGGGNDLLWECTQAERPACSADVEVILGEIGALVDQMILDGVETVVYVGYYQTNGRIRSTLHGGYQQLDGPTRASVCCQGVHLHRFEACLRRSSRVDCHRQCSSFTGGFSSHCP